MSARIAQAAAYVSPNILFRPYVERIAPASSGVLAGWRLRSLRKENEKMTHEAETKLRHINSNWSATEFLKQQQQWYNQLVDAISSNNENVIKTFVTPTMLQCIRQGIDQALNETGARPETKILRHETAPSLVAGRALSMSQDLSASRFDVTARPDFVQLYVRNVTYQLPRYVRAASTRRNAHGSEPVRTPLPAWRPVLDQSTGRVYYMDLLTGKTQWETPLKSQLVAAHPMVPFRIDASGTSREPCSLDGNTVVKVDHVVVWEKCTKDGAPDVWRVCAM